MDIAKGTRWLWPCATSNGIVSPPIFSRSMMSRPDARPKVASSRVLARPNQANNCCGVVGLILWGHNPHDHGHSHAVLLSFVKCSYLRPPVSDTIIARDTFISCSTSRSKNIHAHGRPLHHHHRPRRRQAKRRHPPSHPPPCHEGQEHNQEACPWPKHSAHAALPPSDIARPGHNGLPHGSRLLHDRPHHTLCVFVLVLVLVLLIIISLYHALPD